MLERPPSKKAYSTIVFLLRQEFVRPSKCRREKPKTYLIIDLQRTSGLLALV